MKLHMFAMEFAALLLTSLPIATCSFVPKRFTQVEPTPKTFATGSAIDTSGWVGAEYQPSKSANQDWLYHYDVYRDDIVREMPLVKKALGFTAFRVFLHSMVYFAAPGKLLQVLDDFLSLAQQNDIGIGFVFFDDCWNHAGLNLSSTCIPQKGHHNGCWMASPQDHERNTMGVDAFRPYVTDIIAAFKDDKRVLWWETFNEPSVGTNFSENLRYSAFQWAKSVAPSQPVIACWDEASDAHAATPANRVNTELNDHHEYNLPWRGSTNPVFGNTSGQMKGGLVTEAGARWYQGRDRDNGSPLTVIDWLTKLRADPKAPFVPGVMIDWEVMVSNSNTRWQWTAHVGDPEPAIPWHQHLFPDGSPVSYTEAAAIRRYITGQDDFLFFEDFLTEGNPTSDEVYHKLDAGSSWDVNCTFKDGLVEMAVWPEPDATVVLHLHAAADAVDDYEVVLNPSKRQLAVNRAGRPLQVFNTSVLENGILSAPIDPPAHGSWNILRAHLQDDILSVWLNPMYQEAFENSVFPLPGEKSRPFRSLPPRIQVDMGKPSSISSMSVSATDAGALVDYFSVLPPTLFGQHYTDTLFV